MASKVLILSIGRIEHVAKKIYFCAQLSIKLKKSGKNKHLVRAQGSMERLIFNLYVEKNREQRYDGV